MSSWTRYPKITLTEFGPEPPNAEYIVTEKIHGANFSIVARPDGTVGFASRSGLLADTDNFFGMRSFELHTLLGRRAQALREGLVAQGVATADAIVTIYGELFGGGYPHPDVPSTKGARPVQKGIWYSPSLVFSGFDVLVAGAFLSFDVARKHALAAGFRYATPLHRGDLASCVNFEYRFVTKIPAELGLPALPAELNEPNWAEGIVVRPAIEPEFAPGTPLGQHTKGGGRRLVKIKIPEFSEKQYGYQKQWKAARLGDDASGSGGSEMELIRYEMLAAINTQRLAAVVSKRGDTDPSDKAACRQLLNDLVADVVEELEADGLLESCRGDLKGYYPELWKELHVESRKILAPYLRGTDPGAAPPRAPAAAPAPPAATTAREQAKAAKKAAKEARVAKAMDPAHQATKDEMVSNIDRANEDGAQFEMDKKMRKLTRALDDVEALKAKRDAGNMLAAFEGKKVAKEAEFREEMRALETAMAVLCGPPLPLLERQKSRFQCPSCGTMLKANLIHGASTTPVRCDNCGHIFEVAAPGPELYDVSGAQSTAVDASDAAKMAGSGSTTNKAGWSHYLVLDFEATCEEKGLPDAATQASWSEIIEFPCVLVDATTLKVVSEFSTFVNPTGEKRQLTAFCTKLTSITQEDVDGAPTLDKVLKQFELWLPEVLGSHDTSRVLPVTCGEPDLSAMLPRECQRKGLKVPGVLRRYCNMKRPYVACGLKQRGMDGMLKQLGLPLVGHHHRGIDDARNIANITVQLVKMGVTIDKTGEAGKKYEARGLREMRAGHVPCITK